MRITTITAGLVASLALMAAPVGAMDGNHDTVTDKNAKALKDVPMKPRDALIKEAAGREINDVDRHEDHGKVVYEAKIKRDGDDLHLKVDEDGKVLWRSDEGKEAKAGGSQSGTWNDEKAKAEKEKAKAEQKWHETTGDHLTMNDLPQQVRDAFKREADGREVRDLDRSTKSGKSIYEGEVDLGNGKQREIKIDQDGKVIKSHED